MDSQESKNLKLEMEVLKVDQEIQKKKKKNSKEMQENSTLYWRSFWSFLILSAISSSAITGKYGAGWQLGSIVCISFLIISLCLALSSSSKVKKINKEIERLKKKKKELRNSIR
jgi:hypothetical protein